MRSRSVGLLTVAFAVACSSSNDGSVGPIGSSGNAGSTASAGGAGGQSGGPIAIAGSAMTGAGTDSGGTTSGGTASGGSSGLSSGGSGSGTGGRSNGSAGSGSGGRSSGGAAGAGGRGGSAGGSGCVQNLACKLSPPPTTGDIYQDCVDRINQFLTQCACLPPLARRKDGEACANQMAEYDASMNSAHAGAIAKICQPGGSQNECPGYSSNTQVIGLCMQQMWDEGPPPTSTCTGACYEEHGHFINMTDKSVTRVACGFFTTSSGKVWATQNFSR